MQAHLAADDKRWGYSARLTGRQIRAHFRDMPEAAGSLRRRGTTRRELESQEWTLTGAADALRLGCGAELTGRQIRAHFTICAKRPVASNDMDRRGRNSKVRRGRPTGPRTKHGWVAHRAYRAPYARALHHMREAAGSLRPYGAAEEANRKLAVAHQGGECCAVGVAPPDSRRAGRGRISQYARSGRRLPTTWTAKAGTREPCADAHPVANAVRLSLGCQTHGAPDADVFRREPRTRATGVADEVIPNLRPATTKEDLVCWESCWVLPARTAD
jgi:hypothetical protein